MGVDSQASILTGNNFPHVLNPKKFATDKTRRFLTYLRERDDITDVLSVRRQDRDVPGEFYRRVREDL